MLILLGIVGLFILLSVHNLFRAIAAYADSPKRRTKKASQSLDKRKTDNFTQILKEEVRVIGHGFCYVLIIYRGGEIFFK